MTEQAPPTEPDTPRSAVAKRRLVQLATVAVIASWVVHSVGEVETRIIREQVPHAKDEDVFEALARDQVVWQAAWQKVGVYYVAAIVLDFVGLALLCMRLEGGPVGHWGIILFVFWMLSAGWHSLYLCVGFLSRG